MNGSPWLTSAEAAAYVKRSKRFVLREIKAGRLRAATIGGRREVLTRTDWLDEFVENLSTPVLLSSRRRA
jgi:excisionase family DNA binding protein